MSDKSDRQTIKALNRIGEQLERIADILCPSIKCCPSKDCVCGPECQTTIGAMTCCKNDSKAEADDA
jgi:hypothetical protein